MPKKAPPVSVNVRMTAAEKAMLQERAQVDGRSLGQMGRRLILEALSMPITTARNAHASAAKSSGV